MVVLTRMARIICENSWEVELVGSADETGMFRRTRFEPEAIGREQTHYIAGDTQAAVGTDVISYRVFMRFPCDTVIQWLQSQFNPQALTLRKVGGNIYVHA